MTPQQIVIWLDFMAHVLKLVSPVASILAIMLGVFFVRKPGPAINFQIAFYRLINWKMEPVSWDREIRNTRVMGVFTILCGLVGGVAAIMALK